MRDIFIDANIACKFAKPDKTQQELIDWLLLDNKSNPSANAHLVVSSYLLREYDRANINCSYGIMHIYLTLMRQGRLNLKSKNELDAFKQEYINKRRWTKLQSKANDKEHIPLVFLSKRKYVISDDTNFLNDLINFPRFGKDVVYSRAVDGFNYK
jgi:hypothetical protein